MPVLCPNINGQIDKNIYWLVINTSHYHALDLLLILILNRHIHKTIWMNCVTTVTLSIVQLNLHKKHQWKTPSWILWNNPEQNNDTRSLYEGKKQTSLRKVDISLSALRIKIIRSFYRSKMLDLDNHLFVRKYNNNGTDRKNYQKRKQNRRQITLGTQGYDSGLALNTSFTYQSGFIHCLKLL